MCTKLIPGDKAGALARENERDEAAFQNALLSLTVVVYPASHTRTPQGVELRSHIYSKAGGYEEANAFQIS